jgi:hypothetical protein
VSPDIVVDNGDEVRTAGAIALLDGDVCDADLDLISKLPKDGERPDVEEREKGRGTHGRRYRRSWVAGQGKRGYGIAAQMANMAKGQFYQMKHTEANVLVIANYVRNKLRDMKLDERAIGDIVAVAEKLYWIPTAVEVEANRLAATEAYEMAYRQREAATRKQSRWLFMRILQRIGVVGPRRKTGPQPTK